jgi:flagellar biosynthetic protein FliQ
MLLVAAAVSVLLSVLQTLTSVQEQMITTVPRLAAVGIMAVIGMPWLLRSLVTYTLQLFRDFHRFLG